MPSTEYPDTCARGIPNENCLYEDGGCVVATTSLFAFDGTRPGENGWIEESINWMDDDHAIDVLLRQEKDGELQFKEGVAVLPRSDLDWLKSQMWATGHFDYQRKQQEDNAYHGNLLLHKDTPKTYKQMIRSRLAMACEIRRRENAGTRCEL